MTAKTVQKATKLSENILSIELPKIWLYGNISLTMLIWKFVMLLFRYIVICFNNGQPLFLNVKKNCVLLLLNYVQEPCS